MSDPVRLYRSAVGVTLEEDGLTVIGRLFPFGETARIRERGPDGTIEEYDEEFVPGCTARMRQIAASPRWVRYTLDHATDEDRRIGFCESIEEAPDGVHARLRLYEDPMRVDKWRAMLRTSHTGLSIEFFDTTRFPPTGSHRKRRQIHVEAVTATPIPAYAGAQVLAMRSAEPSELSPATPNLDAVRAMLASR